MKENLHLGCGHVILDDHVNVDCAPLPGVDIVHDLAKMPWPFPDNQFKKILLNHVLEHLPNTIAVMDELWRISKSGAQVNVNVPYWNASDYITDPTHIRPFNEHTFDFFDPDHFRCKERPYYARARFRPGRRAYHVRVFGRYYRFSSAPARFVLETLAHFFCNIIQVMEFELIAVK